MSDPRYQRRGQWEGGRMDDAPFENSVPSTFPAGVPSFGSGHTMTTRELMGRHHAPRSTNRHSAPSYSHGASNLPQARPHQYDYHTSYRSLAEASPMSRSYVPQPQTSHSRSHQVPHPPPPPRPNLPPPPPRLQLLKPSPSRPRSENMQALNDFEKAEMARVIAEQLQGSEIHKAIVNKLKGATLKGMTFSRIAWAFPNLARKVDSCCDNYRIPRCISAVEVLKEMDQIKFQFDIDDSLRFYYHEKGSQQSTAAQEADIPPAATSKAMNDKSLIDRQHRTELKSHKLKEKLGRTNTSLGGASKDTEISYDEFLATTAVESNKEAKERKPSGPSTTTTQPNESVPSKKSNSEYSNPDKTQRPSEAPQRSHSPDSVSVGTEGGQNATVTGQDEISKVLQLVLKKPGGMAAMQFLVMMKQEFRNKQLPSSRFEIKEFVLELVGMSYLPWDLKLWLHEQLEGYPTSHRSERANSVAGRLMANLHRARCYRRTASTGQGDNNEEKGMCWELKCMDSIAELFLQRDDQQFLREYLNANRESSSDQDSIEVVEQQQNAIPSGNIDEDAAEISDKPDEVPSNKKTVSTEKVPSSTEASRIVAGVPKGKALPDTHHNIANLEGLVTRTEDSVASMRFLTMLWNNYNGKTWPKTREDLKLCVQGLVGVMRSKSSDHSSLSTPLRDWLQEQLNQFSTEVVVSRSLETFLHHFQAIKCLSCEESRGQDDAVILIWNLNRVATVKNHLSSAALEEQRNSVSDGSNDRKAPGEESKKRPAQEVIELLDSDGADDPAECVPVKKPERKRERKSKKKSQTDEKGPREGQIQNRIASSAPASIGDLSTIVGNSLLSLASLDTIYLLKCAHKDSRFPKSSHKVKKTLRNFKTGKNAQKKKKKTFLLPKFFDELRLAVMAQNKNCNGGKIIEMIVDEVWPELHRLGAIEIADHAMGKVTWNDGQICALLDLRSKRLGCNSLANTQSPESTETRAEAQAIIQPTNPKASGNEPRQRTEPETYAKVYRTEEFTTGGSVDGKRQAMDQHLPSSKRQKAGPFCALEGEYPTPKSLNKNDSQSKRRVFGFDASNSYALTSIAACQQGTNSAIFIPPPLGVSENIEALLDVLPPDLATHVSSACTRGLSDIVLDKGRHLVAWAGGKRVCFNGSSRPITAKDMSDITAKIGDFASNNRAGLDGQLHRFAAVRNRLQEIVGLTIQIRKHVTGSAAMISDIIYANPRKSVLILGEPGSGKTTLLREISSLLADKSKVVVVDTTNDIGGDGDIPHASIGLARRMMVASLQDQEREIQESAENHSPDVMVIDKIGCCRDAQALRLCKDQGIQIVASAPGNMKQMLESPILRCLFVDDESLSSGAKGMFDVVVELQSPHHWKIIADVPSAVTCIRQGQGISVQCRIRDPSSGTFEAKEDMV